MLLDERRSQDADLLGDEKLIQRVLNGHTEDFRELMQRYQGSVFRLAYRITNSRDEADDVAQESFVLVYRSLRGYREEGRLWPWIRRITVNCCLKKLSRKHPSENLEEVPDVAADSVEQQVLAKLALDEVRSAISELPGPYRTVIVLRYLEEMSHGEIAELVGDSVAAVQVRLHRARKALTARLASEVRDEV